jgi:hypothetical protein
MRVGWSGEDKTQREGERERAKEGAGCSGEDKRGERESVTSTVVGFIERSQSSLC